MTKKKEPKDAEKKKSIERRSLVPPFTMTMRADRWRGFVGGIGAIASEARVTVTPNGIGVLAFDQAHIIVGRAEIALGSLSVDDLPLPTASFGLDTERFLTAIKGAKRYESLTVEIVQEHKTMRIGHGRDLVELSLLDEDAMTGIKYPPTLEKGLVASAIVQSRELLAALGKTESGRVTLGITETEGLQVTANSEEGHSGAESDTIITNTKRRIDTDAASGAGTGMYPVDFLQQALQAIVSAQEEHNGKITVRMGKSDYPVQIAADTVFGTIDFALAPHVEEPEPAATAAKDDDHDDPEAEVKKQ